MSEKTNSNSLVGRGATEGARLFRDWFTALTQAAERGENTAYVFVMGSIAEILNTFGFHLVFPEIHGLQTAVRRVALDYLVAAEDYGYSPDICGYVKADVGIILKNGEHPMGRIPKPTLAILTNACNTYLKWGEIWERMCHAHTFAVDVPGSRALGGQTWQGNPDFENDRRYVEFQLRELIELCEKITGKKFDMDDLRERMRYTNEMGTSYKRLLEINKARPAVFNAMSEGTIYLGVANALRGTAAGAKYFRDLVEEMEYKAAHKIGTLPAGEKYRLIFVGVPCYPIFRRFTELFSEWGGAFTGSTYLEFASGGLNTGFQYDLNKPLESLAEGTLISVRHAMDAMFFQNQWLVEQVAAYHVDGIVYHPIKSCRTVSTGLADNRRAVMEACDVGTLFIESDMMDKRVVTEAPMKNRIDAFFEGLATRKLRLGV